MLYLEVGVSPIRNIMRSRRLNFLYYILHEDEQSLVYSFLKAQLDNPTKNDWGQTIKNDIEMFKIGLSIKEIENMSKKAFKNLV